MINVTKGIELSISENILLYSVMELMDSRTAMEEAIGREGNTSKVHHLQGNCEGTVGCDTHQNVLADQRSIRLYTVYITEQASIGRDSGVDKENQIDIMNINTFHELVLVAEQEEMDFNNKI